MRHAKSLAIVGCGPSALYLLKNILHHASALDGSIKSISIFEKGELMAVGMPYDPDGTDRFNLSNISSVELPVLEETFDHWLRRQDARTLAAFGVDASLISEDGIYSRLALGQYLTAQYDLIVSRLGEAGIPVQASAHCQVIDLADETESEQVVLTVENGERFRFDRVVISTGHSWFETDHPDAGYFASPWPIQKLLPQPDNPYNFTIGTLGASLSAFDVVNSLSHRHGSFAKDSGGRLIFRPNADSKSFRIILHSSNGRLPHLQYGQTYPKREIYRHTNRNAILALRDQDGWLRLRTYFDKICRPTLIAALRKDQRPDLVDLLKQPSFQLRDFVEQMNSEHEYADAFEGMRNELQEARTSKREDQPIHWKETLDDLVYTLNYHAELLPAEDQIELRSQLMPFLMNVIAAMPIASAETLLALREADRLSIQAGRVTVTDMDKKAGETRIVVEDDDGSRSTTRYRMFVDCSGQKPVDVEDFPFPTLAKQKAIRRARARFAKYRDNKPEVFDGQADELLEDDGVPAYQLDGIDVDRAYRLIAESGESNPRILDISYSHTVGVRPYSYGLQACYHTAAIVVLSWIEELQRGNSPAENLAAMSELYEAL